MIENNDNGNFPRRDSTQKARRNFRKSPVYVIVQFYPCFKFYFLLLQTHYYTLPFPKTKRK